MGFVSNNMGTYWVGKWVLIWTLGLSRCLQATPGISLSYLMLHSRVLWIENLTQEGKRFWWDSGGKLTSLVWKKLKLAEFWRVLFQGHRNSKQLQEVETLSSRETENWVPRTCGAVCKFCRQLGLQIEQVVTCVRWDCPWCSFFGVILAPESNPSPVLPLVFVI